MFSWGYVRKMSPAARRERDMRKARRLMNVVVDEVSSVSSGAGRGVTVQYMKGDSMQIEPTFTTFEKALAVVKYAVDEREYAKRNHGDLATFHKHGRVAGYAGTGATVAALKVRSDLVQQAEDVAKRSREQIAMTKADGPMSPEELMEEATERHVDYHKLGKPKRPLQAFIDDVIAEANGRNPTPAKPVSP
jgi:hypothetical protein